MNYITEGLAYELSGMNVDVSAVCPAYVNTKMIKGKTGPTILTPE